MFHIGAHVLSRLPRARAVEYKEIAERLGDTGIVEKDFAKEKLVPMAKLRNLLVHQYADIDPEQIYNIVHNHLQDIEAFLMKIGELLEKPEKFDLSVK